MCERARRERGRGPGSELLAPEVREQENETLETLELAGKLSDRPVRIGETNAAACTTSPSSAPIFATGLWALDWALRAASGGVAGIYFHGTFGYCEPHSDSPLCAPSQQAAREGSLSAAPEYYGLLAARQLEGGRFLPTRILGAGGSQQLSAYATLGAHHTVTVALLNLATSGTAQRVELRGVRGALTSEALSGQSIGAGAGVTLGRRSVRADGTWRANPRRSEAHGSTFVSVPAASAVLLSFREGSRIARQSLSVR